MMKKETKMGKPFISFKLLQFLEYYNNLKIILKETTCTDYFTCVLYNHRSVPPGVRTPLSPRPSTFVAESTASCGAAPFIILTNWTYSFISIITTRYNLEMSRYYYIILYMMYASNCFRLGSVFFFFQYVSF